MFLFFYGGVYFFAAKYPFFKNRWRYCKNYPNSKRWSALDGYWPSSSFPVAYSFCLTTMESRYLLLTKCIRGIKKYVHDNFYHTNFLHTCYTRMVPSPTCSNKYNFYPKIFYSALNISIDISDYNTNNWPASFVFGHTKPFVRSGVVSGTNKFANRDNYPVNINHQSAIIMALVIVLRF